MTSKAQSALNDIANGRLNVGARMRYRGEGNGSLYGAGVTVVGDTEIYFPSAVIGASVICDSTIVGKSVIRDSTAVESWVEDSSLERSVVAHSDIINVDLAGVTVTDAELHGPWEMRHPIVIDRGKWFRPPAFALIAGEGIDIVISECVDDRYHIGCFCATYAKWTARGYRERLGKYAGWTPAQIEMAFETFTDWRAIQRSDGVDLSSLSSL